jgi:tetratricopeptide (TPR) repeat protein
VGDRLRPTWDFDDLDGSQQRFRALLDEEPTDAGRAEVLTQLARIEGLSDRFDQGDTLLDEAESLAGETPVVRARIDLERGRLRRSRGDAGAALPLFEAAFATALAIPHEFLAVDAAHMVAIAAPDFEARLAWSNRGIDLAESSSDPEVTYWLGSLFNNVGWDYFDAREYETALGWFERALVEREKRPDEPKRIEHAREAVEEARSKRQSSSPPE